MHILIALTYYRPHYSGLTIYAERLARAFQQQGHRVTVLTSRFDKSLSPHEFIDGVEIIRPAVMFRVSKGVLMPSMPLWAWRLVRKVDVVNLHVPQLDAAYIGVISRLLGKPVVLTYHCDLLLPKGLVHALANHVSHLANHISALSAQIIVTNTRDYAENSTFLKRYLKKVRPIFPPVELAPVTPQDRDVFRAKFGIQPGQRIIGMVARLAAEKGVEYLAQALPKVLKAFPDVRVLFVGQHENVLGEEKYAVRLAPLIQELGEHWSFLGLLTPEELSAFFQEAEVTVLPSINETESFGIVQIEAMTCGTPVVATDLPGVRVPVSLTKMGRIVPPADANALALALIELLGNPEAKKPEATHVTARFSSWAVAGEYQDIFEELLSQ